MPMGTAAPFPLVAGGHARTAVGDVAHALSAWNDFCQYAFRASVTVVPTQPVMYASQFASAVCALLFWRPLRTAAEHCVLMNQAADPKQYASGRSRFSTPTTGSDVACWAAETLDAGKRLCA